MVKWLMLVCFLFFLPGIVPVSGEITALDCKLDYDPFYISSSREVITPHTKWINPNKKGPVKVLFITYSGDGGVREVKELAQRIELDYSVFAMSEQNIFFGSEYGGQNGAMYELPPVTLEMFEKDLEEKLKGNYDLIVLGNTPWQVLPSGIRLQILRKIKEGTNLLGFVRAADEYLNRATENKLKPDISFLFPYKGLPAFAPHADFDSFIKNTLNVSSFGKGKIVLLEGYAMPPKGQMLTPGPAEKSLLETKWIDYDYYLAYICHLILFTADKQPDVIIRGKDYIKSERENFSSMEFTLESGEKQELSLFFTLRDTDNEVLLSLEKGISLAAGENKVNIDTGKLPAGKYFADLRLKEGDRIVNFGSSFLEITSDTFIQEVNIKESYRRDEEISGSVTISAKTGAENLKVELIQKDNFGRITGRKEIFPDKKEALNHKLSFSLKPVLPLSVIQYLEVKILSGAEVLDVKRKLYSISDLYPATDDVRFIMWDDMVASSFGNYLRWKELRSAGFDSGYTSWWNEEYFRNNAILPLTNTYIIPQTGRIGGSAVGHVRQPCLTDPESEYRKSLAETLTKIAGWNDRFSTLEYSMGDENYFASFDYNTQNIELCFSPTCVAFFHRFLKEEYGNIANLNIEYASNYKSFDEIQPVTLAETKKDPGLIPLWVDFRRCMESNWAGFYVFCRDTIQKVTPGAKVGYEGSDKFINSFQAADFYKLAQVLSVNNTYFRPSTDRMTMDFSQPNTLLGLGWFGGYAHAHSILFNRYIPWRHLFRGANSLWVYSRGPGVGGSVMASDFSFLDYFQANVEEVQEMKRGIGKLLLASKRANDKIAVLYSASSLHSATLTPSLPSMAEVLDSLTSLLEDTRNQFQVISYRQLEDGLLNNNDFQVLLLPFAQSLSEREAKKIISFVDNGGTVIADIRPGVSDEHGKPYKKGILDEVFGVEQKTEAPFVKNAEIVIQVEKFPEKFPATSIDASLKLTSGKAKALGGEIPALIINNYGKGKAVLLNFSLSNYPNFYYSYALRIPEATRTAEAVERGIAIREFFRALVSFAAGIEKEAKVASDAQGLRMYGFKSGNLRYFGFLQELYEQPADYAWGKVTPHKPYPVDILLSAKYHIYDIRKGAYLGFSDKINTTIEEARAKLYGLLPYQVKGIRIEVPASLKQGDDLEYKATLDVEQGLPELHIFRVSLISPQGEEIKYYSENLKAEAGKLIGKKSLSLNETPGKWKISIKDIVSGIKAEQNFIVNALH